MFRQPRLDGQALRRARRAAGLTQHELARRVGVAGGERVSRWELGTSSPRPDVLRRVADVLDVRVVALWLPEPSSPDLRSLRAAAGLSMDELARRVHVSKTTVSRWESGHVVRELPARLLALLADALSANTAAVEEAFRRSQSGP